MTNGLNGLLNGLNGLNGTLQIIKTGYILSDIYYKYIYCDLTLFQPRVFHPQYPT